MKITLDRRADAAYIYLRDIPPGDVESTYGCDPSEIYGHMIHLDFDSSGILIGIEVLDASKALPKELLDQAEIIG